MGHVCWCVSYVLVWGKIWSTMNTVKLTDINHSRLQWSALRYNRSCHRYEYREDEHEVELKQRKGDL